MNEQHTQDPTGYAIFRDGKFMATESTHAVALHWIDAEIVPLCPMRQRDELLLETVTLGAAIERQHSAAEKLAERVMRLEEHQDELLAAAEAIEIYAEECLDFDECTAMIVPIDIYHKLMESIARVKGGAA